jgi:hypothetical protein
MTNDTDDEFDSTRQLDPMREAVEAVAFGDLDDASGKLRSAITLVQGEAETKRITDAESARSAEVLTEFRRRNAGLNDPVIEPSLERQALIEQANDLKAVIDYDAWRNQLGREPSVQDIVAAHLNFRAHKAPNIRSTEQILESAASTVADKFGIRRQGAVDSTQTIRDRQAAARKARGLAALEYSGSRSSDSDQHVATTVSPSEYTKGLMGYDDGSLGAGQQPALDERAGRISATERMVLQRKAARGANVKLLERE